MRDVLRSGLRRWLAAWFWPLVLLVLPTCALETNGLPGDPQLHPGTQNLTEAVFCDIEKPTEVRPCATDADLTNPNGTLMTSAGLDLVTGQMDFQFAIDTSPAALQRCPNGEIVEFESTFPRGTEVCLNCGAATPNPGAGVDAVCAARCHDDILINNILPNPGNADVWCNAHAKASTNFPANSCFTGACTPAGASIQNFDDPRLHPEGVSWDINNNNTVTIEPNSNGHDLKNTGGTGGAFDAGAVSKQWIQGGDAYVEFQAQENTLSHVVGFSQIPQGCAPPCADSNFGLTDINFSISLNLDGRYYILENGNPVAGNDLNGSWGTYNAGDRFRVTVIDKHDGSGTATVSYDKVSAGCMDGNICNLQHITNGGSTAVYPVRVDTSFRELNAQIVNVTIARIESVP